MDENESRPVELLVKELGIPAHVAAGAMAHRHWAPETLVTQDELQDAINAVANITIR